VPRDNSTTALDELTQALPAAQALPAPIRAELFGQARLEAHARNLAAVHEVQRPGLAARTPFFPRLHDNVRALQRARELLDRQVTASAVASPAAQWLLDNGALLDEQLHSVRDGLPRGFFRRLPRLRDEPLAGLPRIYSLAWAFVAHTDSRLDLPLLDATLAAYQQQRTLTLGELWAWPATLRVVLVENLRRLADRALATQAARQAAHHWFDGPQAGQTEAELDRLLAALRERGVEQSFLLQLEQRQDDLPYERCRELSAWLVRHGSGQGDVEAALQAAASEDLQSIRHAISALRQIDRVDWGLWLARHSAVAQVLSRCPVHAAEHIDSRNATLRAVDRLARRSGVPEPEVAEVLLGLTRRAADDDDPLGAPAWWWRGEGEKALRQALGLRRRRVPRQGTQRLRRWSTLAYLAAVLALSLGGTAWLMAHHAAPGAGVLAWLITALLLLVPASEAVVATLNRLISESLHPEPLPRLAFDDGLPPQARTLVVVPAMLTSAAGINTLVAQLEQHHLANPERQTQFALLTDVADADTPTLPADATLLAQARQAVVALNQRHGPGCQGDARFLLLHRERVWSESERRYIGWERKRGKLEQLLALLAGGAATASPFVDLGPLSRPAAAVQFIITLDSDTDLPPGALRALASVAAHPLNRPRLHSQGRRIDSGYTILQPRVSTPLPMGESVTGFHRLFSGRNGVDPYSAASSEVYQDLFGEGTFTGKGLMHVAAAHRLLGGRLPEGQVLSHDLLEGNLARCASVSDIALVEDAPLHADVAASRLHRWTRGDWQLLPFLCSAAADGVPMIGRWKMVDNLRRSLMAPASLLLLLWCAFTGVLHPGWALAVVAMAHGAGPLMGALAGLAPSRDDRALAPFFRSALADLGRALATPAWHLLMLLDQALMYADAVARALWRHAVSRRLLLQWTTAATAAAAARTDLRGLVRQHEQTVYAALAVLVASGIAVALRGQVHAGWLVAGALAWLLAPLWVWLASRPLPAPRRERLHLADRELLADLARDTWRFYERFVGPEDHHLPPDNVQMQPHRLVAHRTSPTNIGLYLLAACSARELGFIGRHELADRVQATLDTLQRLPRHRGHFFNWIDTRSLAVLPPGYVSTVDSGNLSAHLLVVAAALRTLAAQAPDDASDRALARARQRLQALRPVLSASPTLRHLSALAEQADAADPLRQAEELAAARHELANLSLGRGDEDESGPLWLLQDLVATQESALADARGDHLALTQRLTQLADRVAALALEPDYRCLYDPRRRLLHIGLRTDSGQLDDNHYDLLASEARLASLVAIAKGDVGPEHWSALGRPFFADASHVGLKSWSGSMFEYLMPSLVLDEPVGSALADATRTAVLLQRRFGQAQGRPWGVSESAIAAQDHTLAYQYGPQGVPALALRRAPADEQVVAPYATALAALVAPAAAVANLRTLEALGARRAFGFIEALDYTAERQADGSAFVPVHTYMAHHQAMSLLAFADLLTDGAPRRWALADPHLRAVSTLLHETSPREVPRLASGGPPATRAPSPLPRHPMALDVEPGFEALPATLLLGNGSHATWLRSHGTGHSRWQGVGLTRWRDDLLRDGCGATMYLERAGGLRHSLAARPAPEPGARHRTRLQPDRAVFETTTGTLRARTTVWVSPEDDGELRRVELHNTGEQDQELTLSMACEATLAAPAADEAHPAFSSLFVQAAWDADERALYLRRRPRLEGEPQALAVLFLGAHDADVLQVTAVADRSRWHGRLGSPAQPRGDAGLTLLAVDAQDGDALPGVPVDTGLDPVAVLRVRLRLAAGARAELNFGWGAARTLDPLAALVDKYTQAAHVQRALAMSHTMAAIRLRELQIDAASWRALLHLQTLLTAIVARDVPTRADGTPCDRRSLWPLGISGERPLLLLTVSDESGMPLVQLLKKALRLWSTAGLGVDLVVVNGEPASYLMPVQRQLQQLRERHLQQQDERWPAAHRSTLHVLREADIDRTQQHTLAVLARLRLAGDGRTLAQQIERQVIELHQDAALRQQGSPPMPVHQQPQLHDAAAPAGRFANDGSFVFDVSATARPSRPWVNVLARDGFGFQVSDSAVGSTWAVNSRQHQLTPWSNDPLGDPPSEWLLLHDLDRDKAWALGRCDTQRPTEVTQGIGFTRWRLHVADLQLTLTWCVDVDAAVRQLQVGVRSVDGRPRRIRLVSLVEWQLGSHRGERLTVRARAESPAPGLAGEGLPSQHHTALLMATQLDAGGGFGGSTAFVAWREAQPSDTWTCDRRELFDRHGAVALPRQLQRQQGPGLDPCAALACTLTPGGPAEARATLLLGHALSTEQARRLAARALLADPDERLAAQRRFWQGFNGAVQVHTPDRAFDALVNHWLPYQTLACRLWARSGFYQAGGAYGFRDQLQDAMGLVNHDPTLLAAQIRRHAARQFPQGDVLHWWHEPGGAGVRTHMSDDLLWLPLALALYVQRSGDAALLDEAVPFIDGPRVPEDREDLYDTPRLAHEQPASLYEHGARAIDHSLRVGAHGLPLIGTGDWNDGMNRVGHQGRGESVWLAWFLCDVVQQYLPLARQRGDAVRARAWQQAREGWVRALETAGWDGAWYRRAFFDDGSPLGSAANTECRIDLIAQAWAVLSGAGDTARARQAMASAEEHLFDEVHGVMPLLTPPLQHARPAAGYIQAYPPGVRENGGQYNHAAVWALMAAARLRQGPLAWQLLRAISPAHRWQDAARGERYALEPYVLAGDVYGGGPWAGRGGWSWYTGSAGWLLRAAVEELCGLRGLAGQVQLAPCLPAEWPRVLVDLRRGRQVHRIVLCRTEAALAQARGEAPDARVHRGPGALRLDGRGRTTLVDLTGESGVRASGQQQLETGAVPVEGTADK
jgi:cyclic beta-1,2-glucan synthetase